MFPECEAVDVNTCSSSNYVCLSAKLFSSAYGKDLNGDCVDVVYFFIGEVHDDLVEAIIFTSLELNGLVT